MEIRLTSKTSEALMTLAEFLHDTMTFKRAASTDVLLEKVMALVPPVLSDDVGDEFWPRQAARFERRRDQRFAIDEEGDMPGFALMITRHPDRWNDLVVLSPAATRSGLDRFAERLIGADNSKVGTAVLLERAADALYDLDGFMNDEIDAGRLDMNDKLLYAARDELLSLA